MRIKDYLQELALKLEVDARRKRRILREIEEHLLEAAYREEVFGASRAEAERRAVERFGSIETLAERFSTHKGPRRTLVVLVPVGVILAAALAIGLALGTGGKQSISARHGIPVGMRILHRTTQTLGSAGVTSIEIAIVDAYGDQVSNLRFLPGNKPFTYTVMDRKGRTFVVPIPKPRHRSPAAFWLSG